MPSEILSPTILTSILSGNWAHTKGRSFQWQGIKNNDASSTGLLGIGSRRTVGTSRNQELGKRIAGQIGHALFQQEIDRPFARELGNRDCER